MCNLLIPAYLRKGYLSFGDIVKIATTTTRLEDQGLAERLAHQILLNTENTQKKITSVDEAFLGLLSEKSDDLISYLPLEKERFRNKDPNTLLDSEVDLFKEFSGEPDLGVGPGDDELIKRAIRKYKGNRNETTKKRLAQFLKVKLLKLGKEFKRTIEAYQKDVLKPYEIGDDPNDIDEERSLENIFDQGKSMEEVAYEDFFIRTKNRRKKTIVYILDISNTMFYELEGLTSINYSVTSMVPLLWSLHKENYGVTLYESNSHIQKDIHEDRDIDVIIDDLLTLIMSNTADVEKMVRGTQGTQTWGGTVPTASLNWAFDQLDDIGDRTEKYCFYFSDFVLQDPFDKMNMKNYDIIKRMIHKGIRVLGCVSPLAYGTLFQPYTKETIRRFKESGVTFIETTAPSKFLENIEQFINGR
jgi:hypothetical protein